MATQYRSIGQVITLEQFHLSFSEDEIKTVRLSDTVAVAERKMRDHNIDQVPVIDTDYDGAMVFTTRMLAAVDRPARSTTPVSDALGPEPVIPERRLPVNTVLADAEDALIEYDWVLTVDSHGRPIGLATVGDALREVLRRNPC